MVRRRPGGVATTVGIVLLLLPAFAAAAPTVPSASPARGGGIGAAGTGCTGSHLAARIPGVVATYHPYGRAPSVAGVTVVLDYFYQQNDSSPLGHSVTCLPENVTAVTTLNGTFLEQPTVPAGNCSGVKSCIVDTGPFGPIQFHLNRSDPPGNFLRLSWAMGRVQLVWTSALATVAVDPSGPVNTTTDDPIALTARALAGDGGPSPATVSFAWVVTRGPWVLLGNASADAARVEANGTGGAGTVKIEVDGVYNGTALGPVETSVALSAIPTTMVTGSAIPSTVDAGEGTPVTIVGDGAAGFEYRATIDPGSGSPAEPLTCATSPGGPNDVVVDCNGTLEYAITGDARPVADLSNGFSSANWTFGNVTVAPPPAFTVTPAPAQGYTDAAIPFRLTLAAATGTPPYGPACLAPGTGAVVCAATGGPSWSIEYAYPSPGHYLAVASIVDAVGINETRNVSVTVAGAPVLGPILPAAGPWYVGAATTVSANLSGGLWPGTFYWNGSDPAATFAEGVVGHDGALRLTLVPQASGVQRITLLVVDAGGTRVAVTVDLPVGPGSPSRFDLGAGGDALAVVAGQSVNLTVRVVDRYGDPISSYDGEALLTASGPGPAVELNVGGPASGPAGTPPQWIVPAGAWAPSGVVDLTLGSSRAGTWSLNLSSAVGLPVEPLRFQLQVRPDVLGPKLLDPTVARTDPRSGATRWTIEDPFGNPIPSGFVVVRTSFPSGVLDVDEPILSGPGGATVWVNYTAVGDAPGTVEVLSEYGVALLPTIQVPGLAGPTVPWNGMAILSGSAIVTLAAVGFAVRARRRPAGPEDAIPDAELERHAAGRDHVLRRLGEGPTDSVGHLASGWTGPPPRPDRREVTEWLSGLIAEGAVVAQNGPEGRPQFLRADAQEVRSDLVLDEAALELALARRATEAPAAEVPRDEP